jgi:signal transduction histidine kinase
MRSNAPEPSIELAVALAGKLREARIELVRRWLDRITARVTTNPAHIFPTDELLNHVPLLIDGIADFLAGEEADPDFEIPVAAKARELGALRHAQGFDAYEILKEHELLAGILFHFLGEVADDVTVPGTRKEFARCWHRVSQAVELIRQTTMVHFLQLSAERVSEREERLRRFNRMVSHELKNHVGAIKGAAGLLPEPWLDDEQRARFQKMIVENAAGLERVLTNLEALSRLDTDSRQRRNVLLPQAAAEAARQLRRAAESRGVQVRIAPDLPAVEVDAAVVELCLVNYLSNAIKYSDASKTDRWVAVTGELRFGEPASSGGELVVRVRDNGLGVPPEGREQLYQQFYRAHDDTVTGAEGSGLGLSIVRETAESMGGSAWAEFPEEGGTVFALSLPSRREEDAAAAGTRRADGGTA